MSGTFVGISSSCSYLQCRYIFWMCLWYQSLVSAASPSWHESLSMPTRTTQVCRLWYIGHDNDMSHRPFKCQLRLSDKCSFCWSLEDDASRQFTEHTLHTRLLQQRIQEIRILLSSLNILQTAESTYLMWTASETQHNHTESLCEWWDCYFPDVAIAESQQTRFLLDVKSKETD